MNVNFTHPFITGTRDYAKDLAAIKRAIAKAKKDPGLGLKLLQSNPMHDSKTGQLKKQFR